MLIPSARFAMNATTRSTQSYRQRDVSAGSKPSTVGQDRVAIYTYPAQASNTLIFRCTKAAYFRRGLSGIVERWELRRRSRLTQSGGPSTNAKFPRERR